MDERRGGTYRPFHVRECHTDGIHEHRNGHVERKQGSHDQHDGVRGHRGHLAEPMTDVGGHRDEELRVENVERRIRPENPEHTSPTAAKNGLRGRAKRQLGELQRTAGHLLHRLHVPVSQNGQAVHEGGQPRDGQMGAHLVLQDPRRNGLYHRRIFAPEVRHAPDHPDEVGFPSHGPV